MMTIDTTTWAQRVIARASAILTERGWTRRAFARDKDGYGTNPLAYEAVCFCASGALWRASAELGAPDIARHVAYNAIHDVAGRDIFTTNDNAASVDEVVEILNAAARSLT